jgi:hypothetical protein
MQRKFKKRFFRFSVPAAALVCLGLGKVPPAASAKGPQGDGSFEVQRLFSFEDGEKKRYSLGGTAEPQDKSRVDVVPEHATEGRKALRLESHRELGYVEFQPATTDWSRFQSLLIDVFNPGDQPVRVHGSFKARSSDPWIRRSDWQRVVRPGPSTIRISLGGMATNSRSPFNAATISSFVIGVGRETIYLDNLRLVRGVDEIPVAGMRKFDFGPASSAVMPGFTGVSSGKGYDRASGYGWEARGSFNRDFDIREVLDRHRPCDDLCRDFCTPVKATFVVDLPDGDYQVWLMLGPPGATVYHRTFRHRTVTLQGRTVLDERYDAQTFQPYEFRWEDSEDLPGDDLWKRYIQTAYQPSTWDATVSDGQLRIGFDGHGDGWAVLPAGLVVWPKSSRPQAERWLAELDMRRKEQFDAQHVQTLPPAPSASTAPTTAGQARGYVRFVHSPDRNVEVNSVPLPAEVAATTIDLAAAPGQFEDGCFGVWPLADCGPLTAEIGDLLGPGGVKIPAANLSLQVSRYKALNHDAVYTISPKYLDKLPPAGIEIRKGITRSFWLMVRVPSEAAAGQYRGEIRLALPGGKSDSIAVRLTVWPIKLSEAEIPIGMFMVGPPALHLALDDGRELYWRAWQEVLKDSREHGMTSIDPLIRMPLVAVREGKAVVDFSDMDCFMELYKSAGFSKAICGYALQTGFHMRPDALDDVEGLGGAARFGLKSYGEMVKLYFDAVRRHARQRGWPEIYFGSDDEYLIHPGKGPERLAEYHRILKQNAPGARFLAVDSIFPDEKPELIPLYEKMLPNIDTWGAGLHTPKMARLVKECGSRLWLYNTGMDRFTFGAYMFFCTKRYDVQGFFQWVYNGGGTLGNYDLMSHRESFFGVVYPSRRGLRTTITWERIRAGCDDFRYLQTAWELIAAAKVSGTRLAEAGMLEASIGQAFVRLTFGKTKGVDATAGLGTADNPMTPVGMEAFRRTLGEGIVRLQAAKIH